jgi:hypothetical protein
MRPLPADWGLETSPLATPRGGLRTASFVWEEGAAQVPPLRFAPVGMTNVRGEALGDFYGGKEAL